MSWAIKISSLASRFRVRSCLKAELQKTPVEQRRCRRVACSHGLPT
ncbi:hypothetical protein [Lysobacter gummosus]